MAGTYDTSDRYALRALTGSSAVSDIDEGFAFLRDDVSAKLTPFDAGARSSRPRSTAGVQGIAGRTYRSADGGVDLDLGTSWVTLKPGLFATLPTLSGNAADGLDEGMEILYQTAGMATALVPPYHLRYDSTLSGTSKWAVISASPWLATALGSVTVPTPSFANFSDSAPSIALPSLGDWAIRCGAELAVTPVTATAAAVVPIATGLAASVDNEALISGKQITASVSREIRASAVSGTLRLQGGANDAATAARRFLAATPIRLG